jgi:transposase
VTARCCVLEAAISSPGPDLEATVTVQAAVIAELRAANAEQVRLIATLQARVTELERRLSRDSSNSSKPPSSDGLGKPARAERRDAEQTQGRRPGKQPGAPGAHLAQVATPDEVAWHTPDRCGGCGATLTDAPVVGVEARQVFDLPPLRLLATEHRAERRRCTCGMTTAAAFPHHVRAAACYGPGVRALVCYLCVHQHLPVDRAAQLLADVLGANVATGTLAAVLAEGAVGLDGFLATVRDQLAAAPVAHFDETGARVAGRLHWIHSASTSLLTLFTVHAKRGKVAMDQAGVLGGFGGVAVHDGWAPYWRYEDVTHALCGAHLLRELDAISEGPRAGLGRGHGRAAGRRQTGRRPGPRGRRLSGPGRRPGPAAHPVCTAARRRGGGQPAPTGHRSAARARSSLIRRQAAGPAGHPPRRGAAAAGRLPGAL